MYLFKDQDKVEISLSCKVCLEKLNFIVTIDEYNKIINFPIQKEEIHGNPAHKLVVFINKNLEIENFYVEELKDKEPLISEELIKQVLSEIGLSDDEVNLYFITTGRDVVSISELVILAKNKTKEECELIAKKFVEKGLFKEIIGATPHYSALPPYAALVGQLKKLNGFITEIKRTVPAQLLQSFTEVESKAEGIKKLKEFSEFMVQLKDEISKKMDTQRLELDDTISELEKIKGITGEILSLKKSTKEIMASQIDDLTQQFGEINEKISENVQKQIEGLKDEFEVINVKISLSMAKQIENLTNQFDNLNSKIAQIVEKQISELNTQFKDIKRKISENLKTLRLGVIQKTVERVIEKSFDVWLRMITEGLNMQVRVIQQVSDDGLMKTKIGLKKQLLMVEKVSKDGLMKTQIALNRQAAIISKVSASGIEKTTERFNSQLIPKLKKSIDDTVNNINEITTNTAKSGDIIIHVFTEINSNLNEVVNDTSEQISQISDDIFQAFAELKDTFTNKIINTFKDVLEKILEQLEISETTTNEFWEKAKQVSLFTMKDIWFIRSVESAKAHINDEILKTKARILIVTPQLTDIDIELVKSVKMHVNVRIVTNIDTHQVVVKDILKQFEKMPNVTCKQRALQDIWGVNRDYEEVIVCVLAKSKVGDKVQTEIAGIGSIIKEHIKIFVPILEEAWLGARKLGR